MVTEGLGRLFTYTEGGDVQGGRRMVRMRQIRALSDRIAREFEPERIILFGSHARHRATPDSDVDLLVLLDYQGRPLDVSLDILRRVRPTFPIDLLVRRPGDTERRYAEGDPLIREAIDGGTVLYERDR